jgi:hypothetical protein
MPKTPSRSKSRKARTSSTQSNEKRTTRIIRKSKQKGWRRVRQLASFIERYHLVVSAGEGLGACDGLRLRKDARLSHEELVMLNVYHVMQGEGTLSEDAMDVLGLEISDKQISARRQRLGAEVFMEVLRQVLKPLAPEQTHPEAFWRKKRLGGVDGTMFAVRNTPMILRSMNKAASRRMRAAFAHVRFASVVELGTHAPLAAVMTTDPEAEIRLGERLVKDLPPNCLLLGDRLYGCGRFLVPFLEQFTMGRCDFLVRVSPVPQGKVLKVYPDKSRLLEVQGMHPDGCKRTILGREIRGWVHGRGKGKTQVRLWTSLLDEEEYPGLEMLKLYQKRWEQKLSFKEIKVEMRNAEPLQSYTPTTALQEVASLLLVHAMLARIRQKVSGRGKIPVLRVSLRKLLHHTRSFWNVMVWSRNRLRASDVALIYEDMLDSLLRKLTRARRRNRSYPREVRQPVCKWKRKLKNRSTKGTVTYEIIP